MTEPVPVLPLEYAPPPAAGYPKWRRVARLSAMIAWPCCLIAWALLFVEVESVLFTGPVIFTLGLLAVLGGALNREVFLVVLGAAHCAVCVLFVVLVNYFSWSPQEAEWPFITMGALYTFVAAPVPTAFVLKPRPPAEAQPRFQR